MPIHNNNRRRRLPHNIIRTISKSGLCSRKQALELVMAGKVKINGKTVFDPGYKIRNSDHILVNEKPLTITGQITDIDIQKALKGMDIGRGEISKPTGLKIIAKNDDSTWVEVSLKEGKNREIRRLFEALNRPVKRLVRTKFGPFRLGSIEPGKWLELKGIPPQISNLIK